MSAGNKLKKLAEVSVGQWGLVTTAQAESIGVDRLALSRLSKNGHLERVRQGVYRDTGVALTELTFLQAEWLMLKPDVQAQDRLRYLKDEVVVGSTTAAWLYQAGDFRPTPFTFYSAEKIQRAAQHVRISIRRFTPEEITLVQGLPTTTPERTIQDLFREGLDFAGVLQVAAELRRRIVQPAALSSSLIDFAKSYGFSRENFTENLNQALGLESRDEAAKELHSDLLQISDEIVQLVRNLPSDSKKPELVQVVENLKIITEKLASLPDTKTL